MQGPQGCGASHFAIKISASNFARCCLWLPSREGAEQRALPSLCSVCILETLPALHQGTCPSSVLTAQQNCQGWVMAEGNPVGTRKMTAAILKRVCLASHFSLKSALPWWTKKSVCLPERKRIEVIWTNTYSGFANKLPQKFACRRILYFLGRSMIFARSLRPELSMAMKWDNSPKEPRLSCGTSGSKQAPDDWLPEICSLSPGSSRARGLSRDRLGGREVKSQLRWWGDYWGADLIFWVLQVGFFGCQDQDPAPCKAFGVQCTPSSRFRVFSFCWSLTILQGTFFTSGWCLPTYNQNYNMHVISPSTTSLTEWFQGFPAQQTIILSDCS